MTLLWFIFGFIIGLVFMQYTEMRKTAKLKADIEELKARLPEINTN